MPLRSASFTIRLDLRPGFDVDSVADAADADPGDGLCETGAGECTLRAAVEEANQAAEATVVMVPAGTYPLANQLEVRAEVAVVGAGTGATVLDGQLVSRVLKSIDAGDAYISDLDMRRGASSGGAGLEVYDASAFLTNVVIAQNTLGNDGGAGVKYTTSSTGTIEYSTIADNIGDGDGAGAAINGSTVELYRTRFESNSAMGQGGGLSVDDHSSNEHRRQPAPNGDADDIGAEQERHQITDPGHNEPENRVQVSFVEHPGNRAGADDDAVGARDWAFGAVTRHCLVVLHDDSDSPSADFLVQERLFLKDAERQSTSLRRAGHCVAQPHGVASRVVQVVHETWS